MEQVIEQAGIDVWALISERLTQIKKSLGRLFGCWHLKMSLPFTRGTETYRTCVTCGARRRFDLDQWTTVGGFYYPDGESLVKRASCFVDEVRSVDETYSSNDKPNHRQFIANRRSLPAQ